MVSNLQLFSESAHKMTGIPGVEMESLPLVNLAAKIKCGVTMPGPFAIGASNGVLPVGVSTILHR